MPENQNIEWKESWRDEYLKWICGFANAQGGKLYLGINDDGEVVGIQNFEKLLEEIPNKIQMKLGIMCDVNAVQKNGKDYLEIVVHQASYPVSFNGQYYYRTGSTNQQLIGNALTRFLLKTTGVRWESLPVDNVTVDELDHESIEIFKREAKRSHRISEEELAISDLELMNHLGLIVDGKLTRAAVLLFHRNPEKWFTGIYTKIGMFDGSEIRYMDDVHGSLILQADRVLDLIYLKYLKMSISYHKDTRVESYQYSREALKEAIFNALCHSNWAAGCPIQIKIEEDKQLIIGNSCIFPETWTEKTLFSEHTSVPYNPDIAKVFFRAGYIESWGRGIKKICDECANIGAEKPEYILHGGDVMVRFKPLMNIRSDASAERTITIKLTENEEKTLQYLRENPSATYNDIIINVGISSSGVCKIMKKLKGYGYILREGSKMNGSWIVLRE